MSSFSQDKIPAADIYNPPVSAPTTTVSTVEDIAIPATVPNENGCTLNFSDTKSLFIQDKKRFKKMGEVEKDYNKQTLKQEVVMGSGTKVRFIKSDCTHHIMVIIIGPRKIQNALPHQLYRQTLQVLEKLQVDKEEFLNLAPLKKSLTRNNWSLITPEDGHYTLPCVDAKCTLKVLKTGSRDSEIELTFEENKK